MENKTRETKEITTTGGHKVTLLTYITGREAREINSSREDADASFTKPTDVAFGIVIKSLDDSSEDIVNRVLDLKLEDFTDVSNALAEVMDPKKKSGI
jgi:hypothetical protein